MHFPTKRVSFGDLRFDVNDEVYEPAEDSFFFAENLNVKNGDLVLDLGTGCGILGILAAKKTANVIAVDLNPYAVHCAEQNARLNGVLGKIDFIQADLFTALRYGVRFDLVLFNAPYLPSGEDETESWIGRSWAGGANGRRVVDRFISQVETYLNPRGRVMLMQSTLTGVEETLRHFNRQNLEAHVLVKRRLPFFETLTLIEAEHMA